MDLDIILLCHRTDGTLLILRSRSLAATRLNIKSEPLTEPIGRGRVILQDKAIPVRGDDPSVEVVCGACGAVLVVGLDLITFRFMFGNAEIFIRCNHCKSYNDATPPPARPYDLDSDLLDHIKSLLSHANKIRNDLFLQFKSKGLQDPRISVAGHLLDVVSAVFLNMVHANENLRYAVWWDNHGFGAAVKSGIVPGLLRNYMVLNTGSLMFFSFSLFESGIRRIVRAMDPSACSGGGTEFKNIYEWLFARLRRNGWNYAIGDPATFLDLYRTFRNTLHNNGVFYPPNGRDQEVTWLGKTYRFQYATIPDFYGWEFNIMLLRELMTLNLSIMSYELIANLPAIQ